MSLLSMIATTTGGNQMSEAITTLMSLVPTVIDTIMGQPVLAVFFCAGVLGIVIGLVKRLK